MSENTMICSNCFKDINENMICEHCGHNNEMKNDTMYLQEGALLNSRYIIGALQRHDSDAAVYSALDRETSEVVEIREFYPKRLSSRFDDSQNVHIRAKYAADYEKYKHSFYTLWTGMEKLRNTPCATPVMDVFELNDTVYSVIENVEGVVLSEYLSRIPEGQVKWDNIQVMMSPVLDTLETMHSMNLIHGSLSDRNLKLCADGKIRFISFPIIEACDAKSNMEFTENSGLTAIEQYVNEYPITKKVDIYAFAGLVFKMVSGSTLLAASERAHNPKLMIPNDIVKKLPTGVIRAIGNGLQVLPEKRTSSMLKFREICQTEFDDVIIEEKEEPKPKKKSKAGTIILVLIVLIIVAVGAAFYVVNSTDLLKPAETTTTTQVPKYTVPNFVGNDYTKSDVENNGVWNENLKITFDADYSDDVAEGVVFKQSVKAGEEVDQGTQIVLTLSKGVKTEKVPDVGGLTEEEATKKLEGLGFKVSTVKVTNDGSYTPGVVKQQYGMSPESGTELPVGKTVVLQIYGEVETTTTTNIYDDVPTDGSED